MANISDLSVMDTSLLDTSVLPGAFPMKMKTPMQEDPSIFQSQQGQLDMSVIGDLSFIPYTGSLSQGPAFQDSTPNKQTNSAITGDILPRSPVFNFKHHKLTYPSLGQDTGAEGNVNKENPAQTSNKLGFKFENDILTKKFSQKLSSKVLQELDHRMNSDSVYNDTNNGKKFESDSLRRNLFSPRSQIGRRLKANGGAGGRLRSPRSVLPSTNNVQNGFNMIHSKRFNKMESINNHYSVHQQQKLEEEFRLKQQLQKEEDRKVRKKRRTLLGPEDIMEDLVMTEAGDNTDNHSDDQKGTRAAEDRERERKKTLDPRIMAPPQHRMSQFQSQPQNRVKLEPRSRRFASIRTTGSGTSTTRSTLDPKVRTDLPQVRRIPSSRTLSSSYNGRTTGSSAVPVPMTPINKTTAYTAPTANNHPPSSSIPISNNRKLSFLQPTAASLSKSVSNYDLKSNTSMGGTLRKSSTTYFKTRDNDVTANSLGAKQFNTLRKSSTLGNLNERSKQSFVIHQGDTKTRGMVRNSSLHMANSSNRPTWR